MADSLSVVSDTDLIEIATQMIAAMTPDPTAYGSSAAAISALTAEKESLDSDMAAHVAARAAAKSATAAKNASRSALESTIRTIRNIAKATGTTEGSMAELGIPASNNRLPSNATVPAGAVDTSERLRHGISWNDAATPGNKRKPRGVMGCEIWMKLDGPQPADEKECAFLTLDAATPYISEFAGSDVGKMAHYMLRWRMLDGSVSAWGETISATITG